MLAWPPFAFGGRLGALRAVRPFSVSPPAGGFAGLARRRSASPRAAALRFSLRSGAAPRIARSLPGASGARGSVFAGSTGGLRPGSAGASLCRFAPSLGRSLRPRSSVTRVLPSFPPLRLGPAGPPAPSWRPLLLLRAGPGRLASLGSFPRVGPRAVGVGFARCAFSPPPVPPLRGAVL